MYQMVDSILANMLSSLVESKLHCATSFARLLPGLVRQVMEAVTCLSINTLKKKGVLLFIYWY